MNDKRLFIAVPLPHEVQHELQRIVQVLKKESICEGTYANLRDVHVTIQFLGSIPQQEISTIDTILQMISYQKCFASLGSLGSFAKRGHVAIIYVDIISPSLNVFAQQVHHAVAPWREKKEGRAFVPHITLLRVKKIKDHQAVQLFLTNTPIKHIEFTIESFDLMESTLLPEGPVHRVIKRYALHDKNK